jgi:hypothetical protein
MRSKGNFLPRKFILENRKHEPLSVLANKIFGKKSPGLGMAVHACNPNYEGGICRRFMVPGQPQEKM